MTPSVKVVFEKLRAALEAAGVPYFVTGSFASSAHGVPRSTSDIDIVISPTREQLADLMGQFSDDEFAASRDDEFEALTARSQFNITDAAGIVRVQGADLDVDYVERWVAALELDEQWRATRNRAG